MTEHVKSTKLTPQEIERYQRHLVLKDVGGAGQQRLREASVLVIGAGGLGSPMIQYLAAAGIGRLGIVDDDHVSLSNLQRQVVYATADVDRPKVASARDHVAALNPHVVVETHETRINADNAIRLISDYDIVADGSDNFATRYLVSDACYFAKRPLVFAAVGPFDGYVTTFKPHLADGDGAPNPTYRCLFPTEPQGEAVFNCAEVGVLGAIVGVVGTLQATEVIKEVIGIGDELVGRLVIYDALSTRFETMTYKWDASNPLSGANATLTPTRIGTRAPAAQAG